MPNRSGTALVDRPRGQPGVDVPTSTNGAGPGPPGPTRRQLRQARRRQRRRTLVVGVVVLALVLGATSALLVARRDDGEARSGGSPGVVHEDAAPTALLVAFVDPDGNTRRLFLLGEDGAGDPSILFLPVGTQVEVPSMGLQAFGDVPSLGDPASLPIAVSSATGIGLDEPSAIVPTVELSEVIASIPSVDVELRRPVEIETFEGTLRLDAGTQAISGREASLLLALSGEGSELDDLVTVQAVLDGLLAAMAAPEVAERFRAAFPELGRLVDAAGSDVGFDTLPVEPMASGFEERYRIREDDLTAAIDRSLPGTGLELDGTRPRTEIRNGTGGVGVTVRAAEVVVPLGAEVVLTGNVRGFGVAQTTVQYHRSEARAAAAEVAAALGGVPVGRADPELGSIDITIVVGADFPAGS